MKTSSLLLITLSAFMFKPALAQQAQVNWVEPANYTDVKSAAGYQKQHEAHVFKHLGKHFNKMARMTLPEGVTLKVNVVDLDLAGYVYPLSVRQLSESEEPKIKFEYQVLNGDQVIKSELVELKDPRYLSKIKMGKINEAYRFEKRMITEWFKKELRPMLNESQKPKPEFI